MPVEIILVALTLLAQLALSLNTRGYPDGLAMEAVGMERRIEDRSGDGKTNDSVSRSRHWRNSRKVERRWRRDVARAGRLRTFLGEQAVSSEVKLCIGHASCRAESKDLAWRAASLISLLQVRTDDGSLPSIALTEGNAWLLPR